MKSLNIRKNVKLNIIEFLINTLFIFFSYKLLIQYQGVEAVGMWSLLYSFVTISKLGDVGMANSIQRFVSKEDINKNVTKIFSYIFNGLILHVIAFTAICIIGYIVAYLTLPFLIERNEIELAKSLLPYIFLSFFLFSVAGGLTNALNGLHLGYKKSILMIISSLVQLTSCVIFIPDYGLYGLVLAQSISYIIIIILAATLIIKSIKVTNINFKIELIVLKEMFGYSLKSQLSNMANGLFEPLSKMTVNKFLGLEFLGLYEIAYKVVWLTRNFIVTGINALSPAFSRLFQEDKKSLNLLYKSTNRKVFKSLSVVFLVLNLGSPVLSILWFNEVIINFCYMIIILTFGVYFSGIASTSYILALSISKFRVNILVKLFILILYLLAFGLTYIFEYKFDALYIVSFISFLMILDSVLLKFTNEKLSFACISSEVN